MINKEHNMYTFDENLFSDLHKDAYGFRPKGDYFVWLSTCSDNEKQAEWDRLLVALDDEMEREADEYAKANKRFEERLSSLRDLGAKNNQMAIRWLDEAYETNGDMAYLEYCLGVRYGTIQQIMEENNTVT